jgi:hypothetical protein
MLVPAHKASWEDNAAPGALDDQEALFSLNNNANTTKWWKISTKDKIKYIKAKRCKIFECLVKHNLFLPVSQYVHLLYTFWEIIPLRIASSADYLPYI